VEHQVTYHLGAHKTASSLLQKFMRDRQSLLEARGIFYLGRSEMNEHVGWGKRLITRPESLGARVSEILDDSRHRMLVTSHENTLGPPIKEEAGHLYPRGPELAEQLARILEPWPSRVVLYVRPQHEFVESYYLQLIHQGRHLTFAEWLAGLDLDALSWRPLVEALRASFGERRVDVLDFRAVRQDQNRFIADFMRRVDPDWDVEPDYRPIRNASISDKGLRIALAANKHLRDDQERKAMRRFLQTFFSNRRYPRPALLSDGQRSYLEHRYGQEYEALLTDDPPGVRRPEPPSRGAVAGHDT
jgi:hypothetical protein